MTYVGTEIVRYPCFGRSPLYLNRDSNFVLYSGTGWFIGESDEMLGLMLGIIVI
jgi:hypothetical protein